MKRIAKKVKNFSLKKFIKTFFSTFKRSIYDISFYRELEKKKLLFSLGYLLLYLLVITYVMVIIGALYIVPSSKLVEQYQPLADFLYINFYIFIFLVLPAFLYVSYLFSTLFSLLWMALVAWIIAKILKRKLSFKKIYQLSIHASTLPLLVSIILYGGVVALYSYLTIVMMVVVIYRLEKKA